MYRNPRRYGGGFGRRAYGFGDDGERYVPGFNSRRFVDRNPGYCETLSSSGLSRRSGGSSGRGSGQRLLGWGGGGGGVGSGGGSGGGRRSSGGGSSGGRRSSGTSGCLTGVWRNKAGMGGLYYGNSGAGQKFGPAITNQLRGRMMRW
jgi:hypothetical protein